MGGIFTMEAQTWLPYPRPLILGMPHPMALPYIYLFDLPQESNSLEPPICLPPPPPK